MTTFRNMWSTLGSDIAISTTVALNEQVQYQQHIHIKENDAGINTRTSRKEALM